MRFKDLFEKWGITKLQLKLPYMEMEWEPSNDDKDAAWDLYVELLTRITTQPLPEGSGIEAVALDSVYQVFALTRGTLKAHGRKAEGFAKVAIVVLNQVVRPFTTKWHRLSEDGAFQDTKQCNLFRDELHDLQEDLRNYTQLLSDLAGVENLTVMQKEEQ